jgi:hypothetical protein
MKCAWIGLKRPIVGQSKSLNRLMLRQGDAIGVPRDRGHGPNGQ